MDKSLIISGAANRRLLIGLYLVITLFYWVSLYLYMPTLPAYAEEKSGSLALVGMILAQFGLWQALARLPVGIASDWLGRRKLFIVASLVCSGLGALVMGRAGGPPGMIVGRAITGLACAGWVPLNVVFASFFAPEEAVRATSILLLVSNIGRVAATSLTGSLNEAGGYSLAFNLAAVVAAVGILALLPIPEGARPARPPSVRSLRSLVTRRDVLIPSLLQAVGQHANWAITMGFVVILARNLGASNVAQSALMSLNLGLAIVGSLATAAIARRMSSRSLAAAGFAIQIAGMLLAALAPSLGVLFVAQAFMGLSQGIGYPVMMGMSVEQVQDAERATAMGLHQSVYAIGMFSGPWLAGLLADRIGIQPMTFVTAAGVALLAAALFRLLPARRSGLAPAAANRAARSLAR